MNVRRPLTVLFAAWGVLALTMASGANPESTPQTAKADVKAVRTAVADTANSQPTEAAMSAKSDASSKSSSYDSVARLARNDNSDAFSGSVIDDAQLARARGGSDTHTNTNNATGTVSGNVASQLTTGTNTISDSAFSNSSGIPIVIQNSGNNVLIQNSTILNLQLTSPTSPK